MAGSSKDVRAGGAFYELWGKDGLSGVLDKAQKKAAAFGAFMKKVGTTVGAAGVALGAPLVALFKGGVDRAADTARLAAQLNVPIDLMSKLQYAAEAAGVSVQEVMDDTTGRYRGLIARAPGLDPEAARQAAEAQLQLRDATLALQNALLPLVSVVTPYVKQFTDFVKQNAGAARLAAELSLKLVLAAAAFKIAAAGVGLLITAFGALKVVALAAWAAVASPVGLGALLGAGLFVGILALTGEFENFFGFVGNGFKGLADTARETWGGIAGALSKGDLAGAWRVVLAGLKFAWADFVHTLTFAWIGFKLTFAEIAAGIESAWADVTTGIARGITAVTRSALELVRKLGGAGLLGIGGGLYAREAGAILAQLPSDEALAEVGRNQNKRISDDLRKRREELVQDLLKADAELRKKREELEAAVAAGKAPDLLAFAGLAAGSIGAGFVSAALKGQQTAIDVKGGFSGAALGQQFGIGDAVQKQTELLKQLAEGKGGLAGAIGEAVGKSVGGFLSIR